MTFPAAEVLAKDRLISPLDQHRPVKRITETEASRTRG